MNIVDFFKNVGHLLATSFRLVKKLVPEEQLSLGIELAKQAAITFVDNHDRRAFVIAGLQERFHVPEAVARLIVELAVAHLKHGIDTLPNE